MKLFTILLASLLAGCDSPQKPASPDSAARLTDDPFFDHRVKAHKGEAASAAALAAFYHEGSKVPKNARLAYVWASIYAVESGDPALRDTYSLGMSAWQIDEAQQASTDLWDEIAPSSIHRQTPKP